MESRGLSYSPHLDSFLLVYLVYVPDTSFNFFSTSSATVSNIHFKDPSLSISLQLLLKDPVLHYLHHYSFYPLEIVYTMVDTFAIYPKYFFITFANIYFNFFKL